jgi:hypothetical protein
LSIIAKNSLNHGTCETVGSLKSITVNPKWSVVTEEMEHLLKVWLDDQAQRCIPVS